METEDSKREEHLGEPLSSECEYRRTLMNLLDYAEWVDWMNTLGSEYPGLTSLLDELDRPVGIVDPE